MRVVFKSVLIKQKSNTVRNPNKLNPSDVVIVGVRVFNQDDGVLYVVEIPSKYTKDVRGILSLIPNYDYIVFANGELISEYELKNNVRVTQCNFKEFNNRVLADLVRNLEVLAKEKGKKNGTKFFNKSVKNLTHTEKDTLLKELIDAYLTLLSFCGNLDPETDKHYIVLRYYILEYGQDIKNLKHQDKDMLLRDLMEAFLLLLPVCGRLDPHNDARYIAMKNYAEEALSTSDWGTGSRWYLKKGVK